MRLLLTTDTIGGVWTYTKELTTGLLQRGHSVALVSFGGSANAEQTTWCRANALEYGSRFFYKVSTLALEWMQNSAQVFSRGDDLLCRVAHDFEADMLHTNQYCFGAIDLAIPKLVVAHSDVLSWARACKPEGLEPSPWLDRYVRQVQNGLSAADLVVAPTRWMLRALAEHYALPPRSQVIANGRSLAVHPSSARRRLQVVTAGRMWDPSKNVEILRSITAMPVLVAGEPSLLDPDAAPDRLQLSGKLDEGNLLKLFRRSSIYVAASIYEPFGLAALEAGLCGCAILANDTPSLREVWGSAALYFEGADEVNHQLEQLARDPQRLLERQVAARTRAQRFSANRMVDAYCLAYEGLSGGVHRGNAAGIEALA